MNITNIKSTYGYIGFIPFAVFSLLPWIIGGDVAKILIIFQIGYGSIIITFLGGISWGWKDEQKNQKFNLSIGILFSLFGCLILALAYFDKILIALLVSICCFYFFYIFEKSTEEFKLKDDDYKNLEKFLLY